jgi:hypothetical protein
MAAAARRAAAARARAEVGGARTRRRRGGGLRTARGRCGVFGLLHFGFTGRAHCAQTPVPHTPTWSRGAIITTHGSEARAHAGCVVCVWPMSAEEPKGALTCLARPALHPASCGRARDTWGPQGATWGQQGASSRPSTRAVRRVAALRAIRHTAQNTEMSRSLPVYIWFYPSIHTSTRRCCRARPQRRWAMTRRFGRAWRRGGCVRGCPYVRVSYKHNTKTIQDKTRQCRAWRRGGCVRGCPAVRGFTRWPEVRITHHSSRITHHASLITHQASRITRWPEVRMCTEVVPLTRQAERGPWSGGRARV